MSLAEAHRARKMHVRASRNGDNIISNSAGRNDARANGILECLSLFEFSVAVVNWLVNAAGNVASHAW